MEFLRFGSSIPGSYWGCCACDIIQDFRQDPDAKASIQLVSGDGGGPLIREKEMLFAGPTYRDIFLQRIRYGTFDYRDMPNHAFIAILTQWQVDDAIGHKWMKIFHETGFEFIRTVANSVYTGQHLGEYSKNRGTNLNYIFMLVRNIGQGGCGNPYEPPAKWKKLKSVVPEAWQRLPDTAQLSAEVHAAQTEIWNKIGRREPLRRSELPEGTPIVLAGQRIEWAKQQTDEQRERAKANSGLFKAKEEVAHVVTPELSAGITPKPLKAIADSDSEAAPIAVNF